MYWLGVAGPVKRKIKVMNHQFCISIRIVGEPEHKLGKPQVRGATEGLKADSCVKFPWLSDSRLFVTSGEWNISKIKAKCHRLSEIRELLKKDMNFHGRVTITWQKLIFWRMAEVY